MAVDILASSEGSFDCHDCDDKLKEERGCEKNGIVPFYIEQEVIFRCPLTIVTSLSWDYIKAFGFYEKSMLPNGKAWNQESNKFVQAMMILDNEFTKVRNKPEKKKKRR